MTAAPLDYSVELQDPDAATQELDLLTAAGKIHCRLHKTSTDAGIVWVFGAGGGLGGPAGGLYDRLGRQLRPRGVLSLEVAYRQPGNMRACVEDTLTGVDYVGSLGVRRIVLVGHSFGGPVVINAALASENVIGVAALSSQSAGVGPVAKLSPRPLLLMHGEDDEILPLASSVAIYRAAREPKELLVYPGCLHGLDQCREEVDRDLTHFLDHLLRI